MEEKELVTPYPGMIIRNSVSFRPGVYNFFGKEGIRVEGENIRIEGNGSVLIGGTPKEKAEENREDGQEDFSYGYGRMKDTHLGYYGTGFLLDGCRHVVLTGVSARGFERGLYLTGSSECTIRECDFSYNYHNPDWGWDEHADLGGMILEDSHNNEILENRAENVWSALVLRHSGNNRVIRNRCDHTSNVGLRLWNASDNLVEDNDFSWGIRKNPDEVHARDSSCVLIESGSCRNVFRRNDMRYGGDGLFIRSLNNQMSMDNLFEENDASFANNNAIEAWDAGNTYIRNRANYSSYGFWLGCSDHTKLIGNEVCGNGTVFRNAPERFGNAGIAVVNGSGHDFYVEKNIIRENAGPGIAIRYKAGDPSRNWIIKENRITGNLNDERGYRGHGIYMKHALNIHLIDNQIEENQGEPIFLDGDTAEIYTHESGTEYREEEIRGLDLVMTQGELRTLTLSQEYADTRFVSDRGHVYREKHPEVLLEEPGRYRWYTWGQSDKLLGNGVRTCYVMPKGQELLTDKKQLFQKNAMEATDIWDTNRIHLKEENCLCLLYHYENDFIDWEKEVRSPRITLRDAQGKMLVIEPRTAILAQQCQEANEAKYEMELLYLPLEDQEGFLVEREEGFGDEIVRMEIQLNTPITSNGVFTVYRAVLMHRDWRSYEPVCRVEELTEEQRRECIRFSSEPEYGILTRQPFRYGESVCWVSESKGTTAWAELRLGFRAPVDRLELEFYTDGAEIALPEKLRILGENGAVLYCADHPGRLRILLSDCEFTTDVIRVELSKQEGTRVAIRQLLLWKKQISGITVACDPSREAVILKKADIRLNVENSPGGRPFCGLIYRWYETCGDSLKDSVLLYEGRLAPEQIYPGQRTILTFPDLKLQRGIRYHLLLIQEKPASDNTEPYYRWVGNGIADMDGTYGYDNQGVFVTTGKTGWGRCDIRLCLEEENLDFTTENEGMGNRFGLLEMERIFQILEIPGEQEQVQKPNFLSREAGIRITGSKTIRVFSQREGAEVTLGLERKEIQGIETELIWRLEGQKLVLSGLKAGENSLVLTAENNRIRCII